MHTHLYIRYMLHMPHNALEKWQVQEIKHNKNKPKKPTDVVENVKDS